MRELLVEPLEMMTDYVMESAIFDLENQRLLAAFTGTQIALEATILMDYLTDIGEVVMEADNHGVGSGSGTTAVNTVKSGVKNGASTVAGKVTGTANKASGGAGTAAKAGGGVVGATYKAGQAVGKGVKNGANKIKELFKKLINFIKNMGSRFKDNLQNIYQNGGKWVEQRKDQFNDIDYKDMSTEAVPYWTGKALGQIQMVNTDLKKGLPTGPALSNFKTIEDFQSNILKRYHDSSGSLKDGLLNFYRVNNVNGKDRVTIGGNQLRSLVLGTAIPFISNYDKIINDVNAQISKVERELIAIDRTLSSRNITMESFLFESNFKDTEFALHQGLLDEIVLENTTNDNSTSKDSTGKGNTSVSMVKDKRTPQQREEDNREGEFANDIDAAGSRVVKKYYYYATTQQLVLTTYLTVLEERYITYLNILKAVWKSGNTVGGRNAPQEEK